MFHNLALTQSHDILSDQQQGFLNRGFSDSRLIMRLINLAAGMDAGQQVEAILLDFSTGFDKVPHDHSNVVLLLWILFVICICLFGQVWYLIVLIPDLSSLLLHVQHTCLLMTAGLQIRVCNWIFFISQPKHMLWVLKRTVLIRQFFWAPKTHV